MQVISQSFSVPYHYKAYFTRDVFSTSNTLLQDLLGNAAGKKVYVVIDSNVHKNHPKLVEQIKAYFELIQGHTLCKEILIVPGGEQAKTEAIWLKKILEATHQFSIDRHSYIIAIGGGAVLDMVGFASSIAHRGIRHIRIPTTVLAQNDSGIGVKNSFNYFNKKNYLGTFAPPYAVINDAAFLTTLDKRDWRGGIAEAIKVALIKDAAFFHFIEDNATLLNDRNAEVMHQLIFTCAQMHMDHIASGDPFEMGSSRPLDFGHWAAHKIEQLTDYQIRHGEAVAIGIALDSTYSFLLQMITEDDWKRIIYLLKKLGFSIFIDELLMSHQQTLAVIHGLQEFREHLGGKLTIMLLAQIGQGVEVNTMQEEKIVEAIHLLRKSSI